MTDLRKAAEMAMKWMEATHHTAMTTYSDEAYEEHCKVERELRQALAQPEQEPVAWVTRRTGDGGVVLSGYETCKPTDYDAIPVYTTLHSAKGSADLAKTFGKPEQKPVAWWNGQGSNFGADDEDFIYPETRQNHFKADSHADYWSIPLYTAPPPKREWVGLTDAEIEEAYLSFTLTNNHSEPSRFVRLIEAKLKEKNT